TNRAEPPSTAMANGSSTGQPVASGSARPESPEPARDPNRAVARISPRPNTGPSSARPILLGRGLMRNRAVRAGGDGRAGAKCPGPSEYLPIPGGPDQRRYGAVDPTEAGPSFQETQKTGRLQSDPPDRAPPLGGGSIRPFPDWRADSGRRGGRPASAS